jgi:transglutaminase-like putative cysteine protease
MNIIRLFWAAMIAALLTIPAMAQDVADYVRVEPRPSWTVQVDIPDFDMSDDEGRRKIYPLVDYQNRFSLTNDEYSTRYVVDLLTSAAVEDEGTLSLDFDPAYQRLALHTVNIIRDGRTINAIDLTEAMVFRTETDRSQMIFNGTMTFSLPILDVRVGDRLDIAYSTTGRNPAVGEGFLVRRSFANTSEIKRSFVRTSFGPGVTIQIQPINDPPEPERTVENGWTYFQWDAPDPEAPDYDTHVPAWSYTRPTYEITPFENWSDVGDLFKAYYDVSPADRAAVRDIVAEISAAHSDPKARAKAALDWVQTNIRYVGLELGEGGFIPRRPERVLKRRFGDCKDVTLLLLTLLDGLNVSADPILVSSSERGGEFKGLANPYAFDHIMVVSEIDGALFPMDATRDTQLGTLDTFEKGDIEYGLRMGDDASTVTRLPQSDYEARELITERFDLITEPGVVLYDLSYREYGEDADGTVAWTAREGEAGVQESFVRYLSDIYPTLETVGDLDWEFNDAEAWTELRMKFRLTGYTSDDRTRLKTRAFQVLAATPDFEGGTRDAPFAIPHPRNVRQIREYVVNDDYEFDDRARTVETDSFRFSYDESFEDGLFREDYRWASKQDHIKPEDFEDDMGKIDRLQDWSYSTINLAFSGKPKKRVKSASPMAAPALWFGWVFLLGFPIAIIALIRRSNHRDRPAAVD